VTSPDLTRLADGGDHDGGLEVDGEFVESVGDRPVAARSA